MSRSTRALTVTILLAAGAAAPGPAAAAPPDAPRPRWYKGNTHTHTLNTDGDSLPEDVVRWYREHRYHFLVLSDHDMVTAVDGLNASFGSSRAVSVPGRREVPSNPFLLIPGEEVTDSFSLREQRGESDAGRDPDRKHIHLTAVNLREAVAPRGGATVRETLQRDVDAIRAAGGFPIVNHPNFVWSLTADDFAGLRGLKAFELWNAHPQTYSHGAGGRPGTEQMWDDVLSSGTLLYGVASDDAHMFRGAGLRSLNAIPGQAWIMVRAAELSAAAIVAALEQGDFYASTGVELEDYQASPAAITVTVKSRAQSVYDVHFIGRGGRILKTVPVVSVARGTERQQTAPPPAVYEIRGDEGYVRARVVESNGNMAWTQPVVVPAR